MQLTSALLSSSSSSSSSSSLLQSDFNAKEKGLQKEVSGSDLERLSVLGVGAFGTVSLVRNKVTGETYALKQVLALSLNRPIFHVEYQSLAFDFSSNRVNR